jgi:serine/threonine protein phosphatase PrpC
VAFASASLSRIGKRRFNEDRCGETAAGLVRGWVVADGVGGHPGGAAAAERAVTAALAAIAGASRVAGAVHAALEAAQHAVAGGRAAGGEGAQMATTIALVVSDGVSVAWGHVGDSRVYRVRDGACAVLTRDHSLAAALAALAGSAGGDDDVAHGNQLLSSLGPDDPAYTVADPEPLHPRDAFLVCTDGLWSHLSPAVIAREHDASPTPAEWLERLARLVEQRADPLQDNYTAIGLRA